MREILHQLSALFSRREKRNAAVLFVLMLVGSVFEVVSQSFLARNQGHLTEAQFQSHYTAAQQQGKMLSGLRRSLLDEA